MFTLEMGTLVVDDCHVSAAACSHSSFGHGIAVGVASTPLTFDCTKAHVGRPDSNHDNRYPRVSEVLCMHQALVHKKQQLLPLEALEARMCHAISKQDGIHV